MKMIVLGSLLVLLAVPAAQAQQAGKKSTASGVFTAEQAKNGESAFQAKCASCHGTDLHSTDPEAPDLTEGAFRFGWKGKTIANRFEEIRDNMPYGNARSLDDQTYIDIVAVYSPVQRNSLRKSEARAGPARPGADRRRHPGRVTARFTAPP